LLRVLAGAWYYLFGALNSNQQPAKHRGEQMFQAIRFNDKPSRMGDKDPKLMTDGELKAWLQPMMAQGEISSEELKFLHECEYRNVMQEIGEYNVTTAQVLALARHMLEDLAGSTDDKIIDQLQKDIAYLESVREQKLADILRTEHEGTSRDILLSTMSWIENMDEWEELGLSHVDG
jgi:hypothetical protein